MTYFNSTDTAKLMQRTRSFPIDLSAAAPMLLGGGGLSTDSLTCRFQEVRGRAVFWHCVGADGTGEQHTG